MMLNKLISLAKKSRFKNSLKSVYRLFFKTYPFSVGNEMGMVKKVLKSGVWNMSDPSGIHSILEKEFAEYVGVKHAIVVNTGGVAIQMALRGLGINYNDEVIHQVDTCVANSFAIMNAGATPKFSDVSLDTFKLDFENLDKVITDKTRVIMPIHMWGNVEDMTAVCDFANRHNLKIIEDCCLAFGAEFENKKVGQFGDVGIFSFGSTKPIQAGEGGIIVTNQDKLAKKLRAMRSWGEMTQEYGIRDHEVLSWNGRASEVVVAVMLEQFRNFEKRNASLKKNIRRFIDFVNSNEYLDLADKSAYNSNPSYAQVVVRLNEEIDKSSFMNKLQDSKVFVWHANFELIPSISFFKDNTWKDWSNSQDLKLIESNYKQEFKNAKMVYEHLGLGFMLNNFVTRKRTHNTINKIIFALEDLGLKN